VNRTCAHVARDAAELFSASQGCVTLADCTEFSNSQGPELPGEFCCSVPVNRRAVLDDYQALLSEWSSLGCQAKEPCCNGDTTLACLNGQCVWL
jgi:hypothetical protein